jgi:hypothetical protein
MSSQIELTDKLAKKTILSFGRPILGRIQGYLLS